MTQPIDVAYVELRTRGEEKAAKDVRDALKDIERDVDRTAQELEASFDEMAAHVERELNRVGKTLGDTAEEQRKSWDSLGDVIGYDITEAGATARYAIKEFADSAETDFRRVRREVDRTKETISSIGQSGRSGGAGAIGGGILNSLTSLGSQVMSLGALLGPAGTAAAVVGIAALIPAVIALVGAIAQLGGALLLLPAAFASVVAIAAPLMLAFSGIGDAVSALASGDLEKINEAMKNLSPSAQAFAREINALREPLKNLRMDVQESFFSQFRGDLTEMVNVLLPTLNRGLTTVSSALGRVVAGFIELLGANDIIEDIGDIFESVGRIIDRLGPSVIDFVGVLFGVIEAGLPWLERAADALGDLIDEFSGWLSGTLQDGSFNEFMENAFTTISNLWELAKSIGRLLAAIFGGAGDEGNDFIVQLTEIIDKMTEWFNSLEGQQALQDILDGIKYLVNMLKILAKIVEFTVQTLAFFYNATDAMVDVLTIATVAVGAFFKALWGWIQTAWGAVQSFFGMLGDWLGNVGEWFSNAWDSVVTFFNQTVQWFTELPGRIMTAIANLPGQLIAFFTQLGEFIRYTVGFTIGSVIKFFMDMPGRLLAAGEALIAFIVSTFTIVRDFMVNITVTAIEAVIAFFVALPGRVWSAIISVVAFVSGVFTSLYNSARTIVSNLINSVVNYFRKLPQQAADATASLPTKILNILKNLANRAVDAGRDVMEGVARGIRNGVNSAINAAQDAAFDVLRGFWDALEIGSPSKVAATTVGEPIMQGVGVGIEDEAPELRDVINNSVVGALPTGMTPRGGAGSSSHVESIVFGEGAIQVIFEGVIPTEDEARAVGMSVGSGVSQTLAKRNVRTSVRTV